MLSAHATIDSAWAGVPDTVLAQRFDVSSLWAKRLAQAEFANVGHFFVAQLPVQTAQILGRFPDKNKMGSSPAAPPVVSARLAGN